MRYNNFLLVGSSSWGSELLTAELIRFGEDFELDLRAYELRRGGRSLRLEPIPMGLLVLLVERRGVLVTRDQIVERVWDKNVYFDTDNSINSAVRKLRQALKDDPDRPKFILTVTGKGYRFVAPVEEVVPPAALGREPKLESPSSDAALLGKKISHYRITQMLGGGGMGVVYKAEDLRLGRTVALKFLPSELDSDPVAFERLQREARAASSLDHPNICSIFQLDEHEGQPFIVMQFLEGQTLREWIESASATLPEERLANLVELAIQIADGLEAAHRNGIVHRDIKPTNIIITTRGQAKILDFGVAKFIDSMDAAEAKDAPHQATGEAPNDGDLHLTRTGASLGTPSYLSPEQIRREKIDARTDLFSFGLVLYEMATGHRAFSGSTVTMIREAVLSDALIPASGSDTSIPPILDHILAKALQKDRNLRYQSAAEMQTDLQGLKNSLAHEGRLTPAPRAKSRVRFWVVAGLTLVIAAGVSIATFIRSSHARAQRLSDQDTIVLADFANSTGDVVFDDTLKQALNVSLSQSPFLNILPNSKANQTLKQMTRPPNTPLTPDIVQELCVRAGSKAYVAGAIGALGTEYVLGLKAVNCQSGDLLAQEQVTVAKKERVLDALGTATTRLRSALGESLASVQRLDVPLDQGTTPSLEALKYYTDGRHVLLSKGMTAAIPYYEHAIALDPNFASAYLSLGVAYSNLNQFARARVAVTKAYELSQHVSEREKYTISSYYNMQVTGNLDKSIQIYQEWLANYPRSVGALVNMGQAYAEEGQYEKGIELAQRARTYEKNAIVYGNIVLYQIKVNRFDEARKTLEEAGALNFDDDVMHLNSYRLAFLQGNERGMDEHASWFDANPDYQSEMLRVRSQRAAYTGHLKQAREFTVRAVETSKRVDNIESAAFAHTDSALREALYGNFPLARREAAAALALAHDSRAVEREAGLAYALAGDSAHAQAIANDLAKNLPEDTIVQSVVLPAIRAKLEIDRNHPDQAITLLESARPYEFGDNLNGCAYSAYLRGQALLRAGKPSPAADDFRRILDHRGVVLSCPTGAAARLGLARALTMQAASDRAASAEREPARKAYREFLSLWKDADPDIPSLQEAKTEFARLQ